MYYILPVQSQKMLNFLQWLTVHHPELTTLRTADRSTLGVLVAEFEGTAVTAVTGAARLSPVWERGFHELTQGGIYHAGEPEYDAYQQARRTFVRLV